MRPGALFAGALVLFAILGLVAGRAPEAPQPREAAGVSAPTAPLDEDEPRRLAARWGRSYASWTHASLAARLEALASSAAPDLAEELRRGAQAVRRDVTLVRDGAGSRGRVEVVRVRVHGQRRRVLVVTREHPYVGSGSDLHGPRFRVYVGTLVQSPESRWLMETWERQP